VVVAHRRPPDDLDPIDDLRGCHRGGVATGSEAPASRTSCSATPNHRASCANLATLDGAIPITYGDFQLRSAFLRDWLEATDCGLGGDSQAECSNGRYLHSHNMGCFSDELCHHAECTLILQNLQFQSTRPQQAFLTHEVLFRQ